MSIEIASNSDLPVLRRLLRMGRYVYWNIADEDLPGVVQKHMTCLLGEANYPWGALVVDPERPRAASLPEGAPDRAQVRALALRQGPWIEEAGSTLRQGLELMAPLEARPLLVSSYASEPWLRSQLEAAGFVLADMVEFFRLDTLDAPPSPSHGGVTLRPTAFGEIEQVAALDAATFEPLWHFGAAEIVEMMVRGRVQVACRDGVIVGYSALIAGPKQEAHLARLAVHPDSQGSGIGRLLLLDAIAWAHAEGYATMALNTQASNGRSQALYRSVGFRPSGVALPTYTLVLH